MALEGVYQLFIGYDFFLQRPLQAQRITAVVFSPNHLGLILMVNLQLLLFLITNPMQGPASPGKTSLLAVLLFLALITLLYTGSRAAWVSTSFSVILYFIINHRNLRLSRFWLIGAGLVAAAIFLALTNAGIYYQWEALVHGNSGYRIETWQFMLKHIGNHPVVGNGIMGSQFWFSRAIKLS